MPAQDAHHEFERPALSSTQGLQSLRFDLENQPLVKSGKKRFVRYQEGAELYSMGLHTFEQLAKEAGAIYKIRRVVLVNLDIFDEYLDTFRM